MTNGRRAQSVLDNHAVEALMNAKGSIVVELVAIIMLGRSVEPT
ncbi:hypothetical protein [Rhodopseudomonas palustris]|nr:hypothetical protein [Rhodopseudomonas palustris]